MELRNSQMEEMPRARHRERAQSLHALPRLLLFHVSPSPEALGTPSFWVLLEASFYRHNWLNQWLLATDSALTSSILLEVQ